jgi:CubicO group peptidase (beta-lactamase class C family)
MGVTQQVIDALKSKIDLATAKPNGIPGLACAVVDRNGDLLFEYAAGKRGVGSDVPMTTDTVFWLASCTKMIVSVAALQLAEQGILDLDDAGVVEKLAPELKEVKVLQEDAAGKLILMEKEQRITMRMLLCHTGELLSCASCVCVVAYENNQLGLATVSQTQSSRNGMGLLVKMSFPATLMMLCRCRLSTSLA